MIIVSRRCSISQAACVVQGLGDNDNASFSTLSDISGTIRAKMRVHTHLKKQWLHHQRNLQNVATNRSIPSFADKVTVHCQMLILVLEFIFSCFFWASLSPTHCSLCPTTARHPFLTAAAELLDGRSLYHCFTSIIRFLLPSLLLFSLTYQIPVLTHFTIIFCWPC